MTFWPSISSISHGPRERRARAGCDNVGCEVAHKALGSGQQWRSVQPRQEWRPIWLKDCQTTKNCQNYEDDKGKEGTTCNGPWSLPWSCSRFHDPSYFVWPKEGSKTCSKQDPVLKTSEIEALKPDCYSRTTGEPSIGNIMKFQWQNGSCPELVLGSHGCPRIIGCVRVLSCLDNHSIIVTS